MRRRTRSFAGPMAVASLVIGGLAAAPFAQAQPTAGTPGPTADAKELSVWTAQVTAAQVPLLLKAGVDGHELGERITAGRTGPVELTLTGEQAGALRRQGVDLAEKRLSRTVQERLQAAGDGVFRPYSGERGLKREITDTAAAHPGLTKVVSIGKTVRGQDILALKVTKDAGRTRDGDKPAVLYMSNQHAREWITPEMTRRLMHHYLDGYGKDKRITQLVDRSELWFLLSANPDGYDYTFQSPATRLWRKNLRDNDGDGKIAPGDGVDLNRNFSYKWGYDNEGSSPRPASETYRGPAPASEPETKALDAFQKRVHFRYAVNYHSAAELLLYGVGWQVATPTPDDVLYRALAGTPQKSAIPGYHPQLSSELYTTNGEADGHASNVNGTMMFTPEMSTCQTASKVDPDDPWKPGDCRSGFTFPDDEKLIQQEFAKNIPFALSVAETAAHPDRPAPSAVLTAPDLTPHPFATSYARGEEQPVAVTARKSLRDKRLNYRVDGGRTHTAPLEAWEGGDRYGGEDNLHFDQYRADVEGADPGSTVRVWFTARTREGRATASEPFTYKVAERPRTDTLVLADEGGTTPSAHTAAYTKALAAVGREAAVWDVARQGAPDALGVLGHFTTVVWYSGANTPGGATLLATRDFVNEGGKLIAAGPQAGGDARVGEADTNDFSQYYLGSGGRIAHSAPSRFTGAGKLSGTSATLAAPAGAPPMTAGAYSSISDELPPAAFPRFRSEAAGDYVGVRSPFQPYEGAWMAAARHQDNAWMRLTRTVDLTGVAAADKPSLGFRLSHDTERGYDHAVLEARTAGRDDWTTLPDTNGGTGRTTPTDCSAAVHLHPFLGHYLTVGDDTCEPKGTTGAWHSFTGPTTGWRQVSFDLSAYAGKKAEVALSYITDGGDGGRGVFADNAALTVGGTARPTEGFETSLGDWATPGAPAGSPGNTGDWARSQELLRFSAAVTTRDTVLLGFGLEQVPDARERATLLGAALRAIGG
ncbi:M14 family metallopeptidase [Streptomyces sp. ISL-11]|uniref:M14 family metallopeptidase n=1 Tax=Streptomyces sp. ISL-11 TaxID=2819174 RepID=UPI001BEB1AFF|nr:M14 family metallopeptidase [Streptomyces sp. ISL-11]MBT2385895.1 immune inhibitor A [Streptomyces sp. ISL-11]